MLEELRIRNLGVVDEVELLLSPGMTAVTGETGAGKTMLVEAVRLLTGGRGEASMVRTGATEASVEGRFVSGSEETTLARVVSKEGRSRAYVDGRVAPVSALSEVGEGLVDLHGQHAHHRLLSVTHQRHALDAFGAIDLEPVRAARRRLTQIDADLAKLGGDAQSRARELDVVQFQIDELDAAELEDPNEDDALREEEDLLADAGAHREAASVVHGLLADEGGVLETVAAAVKTAGGRAPLAEIEQRLRLLSGELSDLSMEAGLVADRLQDDPRRLEQVQSRRQLLRQLVRKYGPTLAEVIAYRDETRVRLSELAHHDELVAELEETRKKALQDLQKAEAKVAKQRKAIAPKLAKEVEVRLRELALPNARFEVRVGDDSAGDEVEFLLGPNPGMPLLPIAKAASGGELARTMLALRLSLLGAAPGSGVSSGLGEGPADEGQAAAGASTAKGSAGGDTEVSQQVLVFDEVDSGIGGEAAVAVGRALAALARASNQQVLVVTHLPQVAAFADQQISVEKEHGKSSTVARVRVLEVEEREVELARMLSGRPDSASGRAHARELLDLAQGVRA